MTTTKFNELLDAIYEVSEAYGSYRPCEYELCEFFEVAHELCDGLDRELVEAWSEIAYYGNYDEMSEQLEELIENYEALVVSEVLANKPVSSEEIDAIFDSYDEEDEEDEDEDEDEKVEETTSVDERIAIMSNLTEDWKALTKIKKPQLDEMAEILGLEKDWAAKCVDKNGRINHFKKCSYIRTVVRERLAK